MLNSILNTFEATAAPSGSKFTDSVQAAPSFNVASKPLMRRWKIEGRTGPAGETLYQTKIYCMHGTEESPNECVSLPSIFKCAQPIKCPIEFSKDALNFFDQQDFFQWESKGEYDEWRPDIPLCLFCMQNPKVTGKTLQLSTYLLPKCASYPSYQCPFWRCKANEQCVKGRIFNIGVSAEDESRRLKAGWKPHAYAKLANRQATGVSAAEEVDFMTSMFKL